MFSKACEVNQFALAGPAWWIAALNLLILRGDPYLEMGQHRVDNDDEPKVPILLYTSLNLSKLTGLKGASLFTLYAVETDSTTDTSIN
ncbi:jg17270 [Pararge aegeria aegeria]|uniref:Jg17270 protein n=1 Tax=Pararge aegeria aegeria TaxID=348720 RepID=A0A8S4SRC0_9NEOP|nr:jg17270 [Pararge aegeria aegeria]